MATTLLRYVLLVCWLVIETTAWLGIPTRVTRVMNRETNSRILWRNHAVRITASTSTTSTEPSPSVLLRQLLHKQDNVGDAFRQAVLATEDSVSIGDDIDKGLFDWGRQISELRASEEMELPSTQHTPPVNDISGCRVTTFAAACESIGSLTDVSSLIGFISDAVQDELLELSSIETLKLYRQFYAKKKERVTMSALSEEAQTWGTLLREITQCHSSEATRYLLDAHADLFVSPHALFLAVYALKDIKQSSEAEIRFPQDRETLRRVVETIAQELVSLNQEFLSQMATMRQQYLLQISELCAALAAPPMDDNEQFDSKELLEIDEAVVEQLASPTGSTLSHREVLSNQLTTVSSKVTIDLLLFIEHEIDREKERLTMSDSAYNSESTQLYWLRLLHMLHAGVSAALEKRFSSALDITLLLARLDETDARQTVLQMAIDEMPPLELPHFRTLVLNLCSSIIAERTARPEIHAALQRHPHLMTNLRALQKEIEKELPLDALRQRLGKAAIEAGRPIGYSVVGGDVVESEIIQEQMRIKRSAISGLPLID